MICAVSGLKAQFSLTNDVAYTFKDTCLKFSPIENDSLKIGSVYKANIIAGPNNGSFSLDTFAPFKATFCPSAGFVGMDSVQYRICDTGTLICKNAMVYLKIEALANSNVSFAGDLNHDGIVNSLDYLFLANANRYKGKRIPGRQTTWKTNYAADWNEYLWGVDLKYMDANGNGIIDTGDLSIIQQNILKTRSDFKMNFFTVGFERNKVLPVYTKMNKKVFALGDTLQIEVFFGDSIGLSSADRDITGAAFTLTLNPDIAVLLKNAKAWFETTGNWITKTAPHKIEAVSRYTDKFAFDVALSKLNHIQYDKNQQQNCNNLKLALTTRDKIDVQQFADVYSSITGGTPPYTYYWSNGASTANISGINNVFPSTHNLSATDANGCVTSSQITLLDRSAGGKGFLGTLKVIIEDDIMQLANNQNTNIEFILEKVYLVDDQEPEFVKVESHHDKLKSLINKVESNVIHEDIEVTKLEDGKWKIGMEEGTQITEVNAYDILGRANDLEVKITGHEAFISWRNFVPGVQCIMISTEKEKYSIKINQ